MSDAPAARSPPCCWRPLAGPRQCSPRSAWCHGTDSPAPAATSSSIASVYGSRTAPWPRPGSIRSVRDGSTGDSGRSAVARPRVGHRPESVASRRGREARIFDSCAGRSDVEDEEPGCIRWPADVVLEDAIAHPGEPIGHLSSIRGQTSRNRQPTAMRRPWSCKVGAISPSISHDHWH
jgi:hypothetical protein